MINNIPLFKPNYDVNACLKEIKECLEKGWTGIGYKTELFETAFGEYIENKYCHFVNSNTNGIHLLLEVLKIQNGWDANSEIISSPMTFVSANHSILHSDLILKLADVDESLNINPNNLEKLINKNTKAIVFVSIGGNSKNLLEIYKICKENSIILIHDCAHSTGSNYLKTNLSKYADYSIYSFQAVKNLPTADSGMVCFKNDKELALAKKLSWCGINKDTYNRNQDGYKWLYDVEYIGFKYHGNSIMAAIGLAQLNKIQNDNFIRRQIVKKYQNGLKKNENIKIIYHENEDESSRHLFQLIVKDRDKLINFLAEENIGTGVHYRSNTRYLMYKNNECPFAEKMDQKIISLPLFTTLTSDEVEYIVDKIVSFYR